MKDKAYVKVTANKLYKRNLTIRIALIIVAILLLVLSIMYAVLYVINVGGNFTISLDPNLKSNNSISISSYSDFRESSIILKADALDYMDNITESWIPSDVLDHEGPHNGENYIAYTFFIKNNGEGTSSYHTTIDIQSVIKNVDDAVRVAVYINGDKTVYAKRSSSGDPEPNTTPFVSNTQVMSQEISNFDAGAVNKYTIVIWLEGNDPECIDDILGGEMNMLMQIVEGHNG